MILCCFATGDVLSSHLDHSLQEHLCKIIGLIVFFFFFIGKFTENRWWKSHAGRMVINLDDEKSSRKAAVSPDSEPMRPRMKYSKYTAFFISFLHSFFICVNRLAFTHDNGKNAKYKRCSFLVFNFFFTVIFFFFYFKEGI